VRVSARGIRVYARKTLGLKRYFGQPGDGRVYPVVAASTLLWAQVLGYLLCEPAYHAVSSTQIRRHTD